MEINIGAPEAIYLFMLITGLVMRIYSDAVKSINRIDLVLSIIAIVLSGCIDIALLTWGGFFS